MARTKSIINKIPAYLMEIVITLKMEPKSFGELDKQIGSPAIISRRIKFLLHNGYIEAKPSDDKRIRCLWKYHITKKGIALAEDMEPIYYRLKALTI